MKKQECECGSCGCKECSRETEKITGTNCVSRPKMARLAKIKKECPEITTYFFDYPCGIKPGQFVMLWLPGMDEKPFAVAYADGKQIGLGVLRKGNFTLELEKLKPGTKLGLRGPYGNGFKTDGVKSAAIVAGGSGMAAMPLLAKELKESGAKVFFVQGARGRERIWMQGLAEKYSSKSFVATEDGSMGQKGYATDVLEQILAKEKIGTVFACGPEAMLVKVFEICEKRKVKCQLSLERYFKCGGMGLCGQCAFGPYLLCVDGPVLAGDQIRKVQDFGKTARIKSGRLVSLHEFHGWRANVK